MKAIRTRFIGPSNVKGARVKADDGDGNTVTLSYDYALGADKTHKLACDALCAKMQWRGELQGGSFMGDMFWVFVQAAKESGQ